MKLFTGSDSRLRPSRGSWMSYGLGTENQNLPSFITICPTSLHGGVDNFGTAFLPSIHQGVPLGTPGYPNTLMKNAKFEFLENSFRTSAEQQAQLGYLKRINQRHLRTTGPNSVTRVSAPTGSRASGVSAHRSVSRCVRRGVPMVGIASPGGAGPP